MTVTETVCENCGNVTTDDPPDPYCSQCGKANPWEERSAYRFDPDDLPIVFSVSHGGGKWKPWREFCSQYFGVYEIGGKDVDGLPEEFPRLKYSHVEVYYKIDEDYELHGPFLDRSEARNA